jgi:F-type H+-transporting ATPase subunit epsilon
MSKPDNIKRQIDHPGMLGDTLKVDIVSAERSIYSGRAKAVIVTSEEGELGIFPGHVQLLASLKPGHVRLISKSGEEDEYYVSSGFVEVQPDSVTILANTVLRSAEIDEEQALLAKERAEKELLTRKGLDNYTSAMIELNKAIAKLRVFKHKKQK